MPSHPAAFGTFQTSVTVLDLADLVPFLVTFLASVLIHWHVGLLEATVASVVDLPGLDLVARVSKTRDHSPAKPRNVVEQPGQSQDLVQVAS